MYSASNAFHRAVQEGKPQKPLLIFSNRVFTDCDIDVESGIEFTDIFNSEEDLAIGQALSNEIVFTLFNDDRTLNNYEFGEFQALIGAQVQVDAHSGTISDSWQNIGHGYYYSSGQKKMHWYHDGVRETYEFVPLGWFIAERPNAPDQILINMTCYDRMQKFEKDMKDVSVTYPISIGGLFARICSVAGVSYRSSSFINSTAQIAEKPEEFDNATMRDVLKWIAEAAGSNARFDRDGYLVMDWLRSTNQTIDETGYSEFNPYWYSTKTVTKLHNRASSGDYENIVGSGSEAYLIQDNPLLRGVS